MADEPAPPKKRAGRKPKVPALDGEVWKRAIGAVERGNSDRVVCMLLGISDTTWTRWNDEAKRGKEPFRAFRADVAKAKASLLDKCSATLVGNAAYSKIIEVHARTMTYPDGRVEILEPARTIHEPGDPKWSYTILRVKDRPHWGENSMAVIAKVPEGADPNGPETEAELSVFRLLMRGGGSE
jgi:hypothetical protein